MSEMTAKFNEIFQDDNDNEANFGDQMTYEQLCAEGIENCVMKNLY